MSEMIERVAEAIRLRSCERGYPIHPVMVHHLAAAAIEAMRDPTKAMLREGNRETTDGRGADESWPVMIDEALK